MFLFKFGMHCDCAHHFCLIGSRRVLLSVVCITDITSQILLLLFWLRGYAACGLLGCRIFVHMHMHAATWTDWWKDKQTEKEIESLLKDYHDYVWYRRSLHLGNSACRQVFFVSKCHAWSLMFIHAEIRWNSCITKLVCRTSPGELRPFFPKWTPHRRKVFWSTPRIPFKGWNRWLHMLFNSNKNTYTHSTHIRIVHLYI